MSELRVAFCSSIKKTIESVEVGLLINNVGLSYPHAMVRSAPPRDGAVPFSLLSQTCSLCGRARVGCVHHQLPPVRPSPPVCGPRPWTRRPEPGAPRRGAVPGRAG